MKKTKLKIKKVKKIKKISIKKVYKENIKMAKDIAKTRDKYICQKCWSNQNIHWSHIINEAKDHRLSTDEDNIKALCYNCHLNWRHKNPVEAWDWFKQKRPWRRERLKEKQIVYSKMWTIWLQWHLDENERLKNKQQKAI